MSSNVEMLEGFIRLLQSPECPSKLDLSAKNINDEDTIKIASALQASQYIRVGFQLDLARNIIGDLGAKALATVLQSGNCPVDFDSAARSAAQQGLRIEPDEVRQELIAKQQTVLSSQRSGNR